MEPLTGPFGLLRAGSFRPPNGNGIYSRFIVLMGTEAALFLPDGLTPNTLPNPPEEIRAGFLFSLFKTETAVRSAEATDGLWIFRAPGGKKSATGWLTGGEVAGVANPWRPHRVMESKTLRPARSAGRAFFPARIGKAPAESANATINLSIW